MRLGDLKRKNEHFLPSIRWMVRHKPFVVTLLLGKISQLLEGKEKQFAISRVERGMPKNAPRPVSVKLALPLVIGTSGLQIFNQIYRPQLERALPKGHGVRVTFTEVTPPSLSTYLVNMKKWALHVDAVDFVCSCDWMMRVLGAKRPLKHNHCCTLLSRCILP